MIENRLDKPDQQLGYLLMQVSFSKQRLVNAALKELGITYIQFIILAGTLELETDPGQVTQQDIATQRRLDKAMVSNVVKNLIEKKLMLRQTHPSDGRAFVLKLTAAGKNKAILGKEIARKIDETFFRGIDREQFGEALKTLLTVNTAGHDEQ